jgi:hypothetical protein
MTTNDNNNPDNQPKEEPRFYIDKKDDPYYRHYSLDYLRLTCMRCSNVFEDFAGEEGFDLLAYRVKAVWLCETCYLEQSKHFQNNFWYADTRMKPIDPSPGNQRFRKCPDYL